MLLPCGIRCFLASTLGTFMILYLYRAKHGIECSTCVNLSHYHECYTTIISSFTVHASFFSIVSGTTVTQHCSVFVHILVFSHQLYAACWTSNNVVLAGGSQKHLCVLVDTKSDEVHVWCPLCHWMSWWIILEKWQIGYVVTHHNWSSYVMGVR